LRPVLLGLAYRLLGSMWDAEDVVQEAWLRWSSNDRSGVHEPRAFLITIVSRLAVDHLRSARVRRESYPGPWLPEPVASRDLGPLDTVELLETVSIATLTLMEKLSPAERAVFVLREAFDVPYAELAQMFGVSETACRQLYSRAGRRLRSDGSRFRPTDHAHAELLTSFMAAAQEGDIDALRSLLAADVIAWNDGGGKARAALRPIRGRDKVLAFVAGLVSRYPIGEVRIVHANGRPAARLTVNGQPQLVAVTVRDGAIAELFAVLNPDKLGRAD
jgi:RNA polymerase sigma-70 factor (ECF subfamily)